MRKVFVLLCAVSTIGLLQAAPRDRDHHDRDRDRDRARVYRRGEADRYQRHGNRYRYYNYGPENLPPGLAKRRGNLPPGQQNHLRRRGQLPPGLQKRMVSPVAPPAPPPARAQQPLSPLPPVPGVVWQAV